MKVFYLVLFLLLITGSVFAQSSPTPNYWTPYGDTSLVYVTLNGGDSLWFRHNGAQWTFLNVVYAPLASPIFTGTVTIPTPFTLGAVSVTTTGTELNYVSGVTSAIQTQLNAKGNVSNVGTPVDNQVGVWKTVGTIEGSANLTFDGNDLAVGTNITLGGTVDGVDLATLNTTVGNIVISDSSITLLNATAWRLFYSNATTTEIQELSLGAIGTYLKSNGAAADPTFSVPAAEDVSLSDTGSFFEGTDVEYALQETGRLMTGITDDVALKNLVVTKDVVAGVWTVYVVQPDGENLEFNIDKVRLCSDNDSMTVDATAFAGTDAIPKTVYVYVENVGGTPTLTASNTSPEGVLEHIDVARVKAGAVSTSSLNPYGGFNTAMTEYEIIAKTYHKFFSLGSSYQAGMAVTAIATDVTIATGSMGVLFDDIASTEEVVSTDNLFHVLSTGNFETKNDFSFTHYSDGGVIGANKFYNVILGVLYNWVF